MDAVTLNDGLEWRRRLKGWVVRTLILIVGAFALMGFCTSQISTQDETSASSNPGSPRSAKRPNEPTPDRPTRDSANAQATGTPAATPSAVKKKRKLYQVLRVVDGDTVEVAYRGGVSVRVIGIDTPETVDPNTPDECWGQAASNAAAKLLQGRRVALEFDPTQGRTDAYGRTLAYVEIPGVGDFGYTMIKRGHAAEYTYDTAYKHQGKYRTAERRARAAGKGLWGQCGGPDVPLHRPSPRPVPAPRPEPRTASGSGCAPGYDPCVPPYPPDVDCSDVNGPIYVTGSDPHGLDGDGDGVACE